MYKRYETTLGNKSDGSALKSTPLSKSKTQRLVAAREFYWASAFNRESSASSTITLRYKSSSSVTDLIWHQTDMLKSLLAEAKAWTWRSEQEIGLLDETCV